MDGQEFKIENKHYFRSNYNSCKSKLPNRTNLHLTCNYTIAKGDSGASQHYFREKDLHYLTSTSSDTNNIQVSLPDSSTIQAKYKGYLPLTNKLTQKARSTIIFPHLHNNLLSIGQLCDDGCTVTFTNQNMKVFKNNTLILQGFRSNSGDGLWDIPIPSPSTSSKLSTIQSDSPDKIITPTQLKTPLQPSPSMNVIIRKATTAKDLATYLHAASFSPTKDIFFKAIKNNHFLGWPGLTPKFLKNIYQQSLLQ